MARLVLSAARWHSGRTDPGSTQPDLRPLGMAIGIVGTLAAWRATQGIYRFDPTIFDAVWDTSLTAELPTALLYRLPEWCCYVPVDPARLLVPGLPQLQGFYVHLEWDVNTHHTELRFVLDLADDTLVPLPLHVQEAGGIAGAFARTLDVSGEQLVSMGRWSAPPSCGSRARTPRHRSPRTWRPWCR